MPDDDCLDRRINQRVEDAIDLCTGDTKDMLYALSLKVFDHQIGATLPQGLDVISTL